MIDLHCHFLPGVDDGPETVAEALALAEAAVANGIGTSVLTAHLHPGRYANVRTTLQREIDAFRGLLVERNIPLDVRLGAEVRLLPEMIELLLDGEIPFLGTVDGFRIVLLEFPHNLIPVGSQAFVGKLIDMKIRPLIAHPERNKAVMHDPEKIRPFVGLGCWLQVTAGSLAGRFGGEVEKTARRLIDEDWVQVLATDAHNLEHRPPDLAEGREAAARHYGEAAAWRLVRDWPAKIVGAGGTAQ